MTDTIHALINRVLDYVARTPGAEFKIWRLPDKVRCLHENKLRFSYVRYNWGAYYISRYDREQWSAAAMLTEDNLRYLLSQLEGEEQ